jgi:biotin synthesis protein BioG
MNKIWLNKNSKKELILFFNGWGMDMNIVNHIKPLGFNVCMLNNYNNLESLDDNFNDYNKIYIVAWSLGVWAAEQIISKSTIKIEKSIAINGTSLPIDNEIIIGTQRFVVKTIKYLALKIKSNFGL